MIKKSNARGGMIGGAQGDTLSSLFICLVYFKTQILQIVLHWSLIWIQVWICVKVKWVYFAVKVAAFYRSNVSSK